MDTTISRGADENKNLTIRHRLGLLQQEYTYNNQPSGGTLISGNEFGRDEMAGGTCLSKQKPDKGFKHSI